MDAQRGTIVDYDVKDAEGNVTDTLPMLVVHVNDKDGGDGSVIGVVFDTDGTSRVVTIPADAPAESVPDTGVQNAERDFDSLSDADKADVVRAEFGRLSPAEREAFLADYAPLTQTPPASDTAAVSPVPARSDAGGSDQGSSNQS